MLCYPCVQCDGEVYLLYNGNEFGRYGFDYGSRTMNGTIDYFERQQNPIYTILSVCDTDLWKL
jgi:hypothetical protein